MVKSLLRDGTEPTVFIPEVAISKTTYPYCAILVLTPSFWLDNKNRKLLYCLSEDLPKMALVSPTEMAWQNQGG